LVIRLFCNITLTISDLIVEGTPQADIVAYFSGAAASLKSGEHHADREISPEILFEVLDKMGSE